MSVSPNLTAAEMLAAALNLAGRGWKIFPCERKVPRTAHGLNDATDDPSQIKAWWGMWPTADIGIRTGAPSNLVVLDVDSREDGDDSLAALEEKIGKLPDTIESLTGGGGRHIYFAHPGVAVRNSVSTLGPGLDVRADGGYVIGPPSLHASGRRYAWEASSHPDNALLAQLPTTLVALLRTRESKNGKDGAPAGAEIPEGRRNAALASLAGSMRKRGMSKEAILAALLQENYKRCCPPLSEEEVRRIAESISKYSPATDGSDPCTDVANAGRLVKHLAGEARYVTPWRRWILFDGTRWVLDLKDAIKNSAIQAAAEIYAEAALAQSKELREKLATWAVRSESLQRLEAMIALAGSRPGVPVLPEELDADPWLLNCPNGTIDLRTGELMPHRWEDLLTKMAGAAYQPEAERGRWRSFLAEIFAGDNSMAEFTQRAVGASITGDPREEVFFLLHGVGANGKTTLIETVARALGDYAQASEFSTFLETRRRDNIRNDIAALRGARFVSASEPPAGARLDEGVVKQITSRDRIRARFLYQESFEFTRSWMIWLAANHKPEVRGTDHGIWRRIRLLPFNVKFVKLGEPTSPPHVMPSDDRLAEKLREELPGIVTWCVEGCLAWQREGLGEPGAVTEATAGYKAEQDRLAAFLEDRCLIDPKVQSRAGDLFQAYIAWCEVSREEPMTQSDFGLALGQMGLRKERSGQARWWVGIGLLSEGLGESK